MIDYLKSLAKKKALNYRTGWARWYGIHVAYYPRSKRYAYFLEHHGVVNRRDLEAHIERLAK